MRTWHSKIATDDIGAILCQTRLPFLYDRVTFAKYNLLWQGEYVLTKSVLLWLYVTKLEPKTNYYSFVVYRWYNTFCKDNVRIDLDNSLSWFRYRAILLLDNQEEQKSVSKIVATIQANSVDTVRDLYEAVHYSTEFLNSLQSSDHPCTSWC